MWQVVRNWLLDAVYPHSCCGCGTMGNLLCPTCLNQLQVQIKPLAVPIEATDLDSITVLADFDALSHKLIVSFKYQRVKDLCSTIADCIVEFGRLPSCDIITAVPLHPRKLADRGFNQAELIAQHVGRRVSKPYATLLIRKQQGIVQKSLHKKARWKTNASVFQLHPHPTTQCSGKAVCIIDDVFTTGATLQACAHQIKRAGASEVHGLCFCHGQ